MQIVLTLAEIHFNFQFWDALQILVRLCQTMSLCMQNHVNHVKSARVHDGVTENQNLSLLYINNNIKRKKKKS